MMETFLPKNEGRFDRALRIALGVGLLALTVTGPATAWVRRRKRTCVSSRA